MKKFLSIIKKYCSEHTDTVLFIITSVISLSAIIYFVLNGNQNLGNYDAVARLNISRKIIDSLTPGVGQLGGVWLPFPQILMTPLVRIDYLWHTGLAGAIVSGTSFVFGAVYLQKTAYLLTKNIQASLLVWFMFIANINILFLQTMALSEMFFMMCLIMILYFLTKWVESQSLVHFLSAAFFVMLITLTRYEGYFVLVGSALAVLIICIQSYWKEGWQKIEGMVLLYLTVAGLGVVLWCIYCFLFYNDPLHWLHLYSEGKMQVSTATQSVLDTNAPVFEVTGFSLATAFTTYSDAILWTNGKITTFLGIFGFLTLLFVAGKNLWRKKSIRKYVPLLIISVALFGFLVYGYQKGFIPPMDLPPTLIPVEARKSFTIYSDSNIRYGIILAPCIILLAGFAASRGRLLYFIVIILFGVQIFANAYRPQSLQYSLPILWPYSTVAGVQAFTVLYDQGLILISANAHEDFMFQAKLPYDRFIYEGSRDYWTESLNNPAKYAEWVIFDDDIQGDTVNYFLTPEARGILDAKFDLLYNNDGFQIYRLRETAIK